MDKLVDLFKIYLNTQGVSSTSIKNYLVDLRNFLEWFTLRLKTESVSVNEEDPANLSSFASKDRIEEYKNFLTQNETPLKTINRRLSTLRNYGTFAVSQGWLSTNPARGISNVGIKTTPTDNIKTHQSIIDVEILREYKRDLLKNGASVLTAKNYLADTAQFLKFINSI